LFEKGFVVETLLFLSVQLFVETDLLLPFPPKLLQVSLFPKLPPLLLQGWLRGSGEGYR
jgi:hypothetical protein